MNKPAEKTDESIALTLTASEEHALRNHFAIILGFCEAVSHDLQPADPVRADVHEIREAAAAALALISGKRAG